MAESTTACEICRGKFVFARGNEEVLCDRCCRKFAVVETAPNHMGRDEALLVLRDHFRNYAGWSIGRPCVQFLTWKLCDNGGTDVQLIQPVHTAGRAGSSSRCVAGGRCDLEVFSSRNLPGEFLVWLVDAISTMNESSDAGRDPVFKLFWMKVATILRGWLHTTGGRRSFSNNRVEDKELLDEPVPVHQRTMLDRITCTEIYALYLSQRDTLDSLRLDEFHVHSRLAMCITCASFLYWWCRSARVGAAFFTFERPYVIPRQNSRDCTRSDSTLCDTMIDPIVAFS